jgi:actin-related protein 4
LSTDEVSAIVLDPGYCYTRAGFAGEDCPKSVIPSFYVHSTDPEHDRFGDEHFVPRRGIEVRNYINQESVVEDWDTATKLWENMLFNRLLAPRPTHPSKNGLNDPASKEDGEGDVAMGDAPTNGNNANGEGADDGDKILGDTPVLVTEAPWNQPKAREKTVEIMMESWGVPAFWLSKTHVLAAFAAGKASALVLDVGGSNTSVACIHDGMCLRRSVHKSPVGGLWLSSQVRAMLERADPRVDVVPTFLVENKTPVDAGMLPQYRARTFNFDIPSSFRAYEDERLFTEFKESVVETWRGPGKYLAPGNEDYVRNMPGRVFEMPDGSNQMWREQRFRISEGLWDDAAAYPTPPLPGSGDAEPQRITKAQTIPELIRAALNSVDIDLRPNLLQNVVITGSTTLMTGFADRLNNELTAMYPGTKIRIHAAGLVSERRFGAWIGGSILASLGTFHQMWISRQEYEENGPGVVEKRCK